MLKKQYIFYFIVTIILIGSLAGINYQRNQANIDYANRSKPEPDINTVVNDFKVQTLNNKILSYSKSSKCNKLVILWTPYEQRSISLLQTIDNIINSLKVKKLKVLPVSIEGSNQSVNNIFEEINCSLPCYVDYKKSCKWTFRADGYSGAVYLLDKNNFVVYKQIGLRDFSADLLENSIKKLVK